MPRFASIAAVFFGALSVANAGNVCAAQSSTLGTPTGGGSVAVLRFWGPGREPCGDQSYELTEHEAWRDLEDDIYEIFVCGQRPLLVKRENAVRGYVLSYNGVEYEGIDVTGGDPVQNCDEPCNFALVNIGEMHFPDVPGLCD